jgi:uncharacterized RDD family membrane protein YckC
MTILSARSLATRRDALSGVRTRRLFALAFDLLLVGVLVAVLWTALSIVTLGLFWFFGFFGLPLFPLVAFFYNGLSVSGANMGTPGMRAMDLEMRMEDSGARVPFINAAAHAVLFYFSWFCPPLFLVSLVDRDKRFLHDMLAGVVVVRRL